MGIRRAAPPPTRPLTAAQCPSWRRCTRPASAGTCSALSPLAADAAALAAAAAVGSASVAAAAAAVGAGSGAPPQGGSAGPRSRRVPVPAPALALAPAPGLAPRPSPGTSVQRGGAAPRGIPRRRLGTVTVPAAPAAAQGGTPTPAPRRPGHRPERSAPSVRTHPWTAGRAAPAPAAVAAVAAGGGSFAASAATASGMGVAGVAQARLVERPAGPP
jgi:hypothetical protein